MQAVTASRLDLTVTTLEEQLKNGRNRAAIRITPSAYEGYVYGT
jgi:hypothetical protein